MNIASIRPFIYLTAQDLALFAFFISESRLLTYLILLLVTIYNIYFMLSVKKSVLSAIKADWMGLVVVFRAIGILLASTVVPILLIVSWGGGIEILFSAGVMTLSWFIAKIRFFSLLQEMKGANRADR